MTCSFCHRIHRISFYPERNVYHDYRGTHYWPLPEMYASDYKFCWHHSLFFLRNNNVNSIVGEKELQKLFYASIYIKPFLSKLDGGIVVGKTEDGSPFPDAPKGAGFRQDSNSQQTGTAGAEVLFLLGLSGLIEFIGHGGAATWWKELLRLTKPK